MLEMPPMAQAELSPPVIFLLREPRRRTCLSGKLVYGDGDADAAPSMTLDCAIRDISEGGARITLDKQVPLPVDLYLISVKHGLVYQAKVVWMKYPARGLKFLHVYMLKGAMPEKLKFLQNLLVELNARSGAEPAI
jgi:hypothetical protein